MSIMIDLPPAIEKEAKGYVMLDGMSLEQLVLMCMENEFARRRERRHARSPKAMAALEEWKRLVDQSRGRLTEPYKFNRPDGRPERRADVRQHQGRQPVQVELVLGAELAGKVQLERKGKL